MAGGSLTAGKVHVGTHRAPEREQVVNARLLLLGEDHVLSRVEPLRVRLGAPQQRRGNHLRPGRSGG
jgi:hypothetical protein